MNQGDVMAMVRTMAEMQIAHNAHIHPDWRTQALPYYRAIWVECAELLDHFGWKWWKKQVPDINQVKLEIVDIWHFGLSDLLRSNESEESVGAALFEVERAVSDGGDAERFRASVEALAESSLSRKMFELEPFLHLLVTLPMSVTELFRLYVGKNVLNNFRQNHGYKTGDYQKLWSGREDNEHLIEALKELSCTADEVPVALYAELSRRYPASKLS